MKTAPATGKEIRKFLNENIRWISLGIPNLSKNYIIEMGVDEYKRFNNLT